jgi:hypothetical protein
MSKVTNEENHGAKGAELGSGGPKGTEHSLSAFKPPGSSVDAQAGARVNDTEQVNQLEFSTSPADTNLDTKFSKFGIMERNDNRNTSRAASSYIKTGNMIQREVSNHTALGNYEIELESNTSVMSNDDFSPNKVEVELFETSLNPSDLTIMNPNDYMTNSEFVQEKRVKFSGAELRQHKKQRRENERMEALANETVEEANRRKFVESNYNIRNKSYAQAAKAAGGRMLEVRSHNQDYLLEQEDYDKIDTSCGMEFLRLWKTGVKADYYIKGGLSQGGVWISCKNEETLNLAKDFIGTLTSPNGEGGRYKVYGEGEKPYLYIQAWIPRRWWAHKEELFDLICYSNRWLIEPLEDGQVPHFRLSSGLTRKKENDRGFFECTFEVDENLFPLIAKKKGQFDIAMSTTKFFGSGIVAAAKRLIMEEYDRMIDDTTE